MTDITHKNPSGAGLKPPAEKRRRGRPTGWTKYTDAQGNPEPKAHRHEVLLTDTADRFVRASGLNAADVIERMARE